MNALAQKLKAELWRRFATKEYPAEWDGVNCGGGKLSQRFWEYFKAIELLDVDEGSVILDIGGGSINTGICFFSFLLGPYVKKVIVMDPALKEENRHQWPPHVEWIKEYASLESLESTFENNPDISHIVSVSVFEHIQPAIREEIVRAIDAYFKGRVFVATFEYHAKRCFFEYQLTSRSMSDLFKSFTRYYLTDCCASPFLSEDAFVGRRIDSPVVLRGGSVTNKVQKLISKILGEEIPAWYPVALKFERMS